MRRLRSMPTGCLWTDEPEERGGVRAVYQKMAMEARCYHGSEGRTKMKPLKYEKRDRIAYISMVLYLGVIIIVKIIAA